MNSLCQTCRKMLYRTDPCRGDGVECGRTDGGSKQSTAARKDVQRRRQQPDSFPSPARGLDTKDGISGEAGTQAPPVDTPKPKHKDRHKPSYQAEKQRQYRANKKAKEAAK